MTDAKYLISITDASGLLSVSVIRCRDGAVILEETDRQSRIPGPIRALSERNTSRIKDLVSRYTCNKIKTNCEPVARLAAELKGVG
jgi:hypothetical protein